jgi:flagellar biosynthesis anti-sigma factor FlgM
MAHGTIRPVGVRSQPYVDATTQVRDRLSEGTATRQIEDAVANVIDVVSRGDDATLSAAAEILAVEVDGPAVRWDRISALREKIASGTYRVDSLDLAEKMMEGMTR